MIAAAGGGWMIWLGVLRNDFSVMVILFRAKIVLIFFFLIF